jgi:hypothetical protein
LFVGRAQEKTKLFRTEKRRDANGDSYPWIVASTGLVNHFYFYRGFAPARRVVSSAAGELGAPVGWRP